MFVGPLPPSPKCPKRLPQARMTIAIGLWTNDGVLLCADTQQSIGGGIKTYDGKVHTHLFSDGKRYKLAFGIAGAGDLDYITTASAKLMENFPECKNSKEVKTILEERWLEFFNKHISPWAHFPKDDRPYVELLISVSGTNIHPALYHCVGTAFHSCSKLAIGSGILLADEMIQRYTFGNYKLEQIAILATYIMARVKHGVDGCGGSTHFVAMRKGGDIALSEKKQMDLLEKELLELEAMEDKSFVKAMLAKQLPISWFNKIAVPKKMLVDAMQSTPRKSEPEL